MNPPELRYHAKEFVRALLPGGMVALAKRLKLASAGRLEWEYLPAGWQAQSEDPRVKGWNVESVRDAYIRQWPGFVAEMQGERAFGRGDQTRQTVVLCYAYALARAAAGQTTLSLLDWGGGIGFYLLLTQTLFPELELDYSCKDVPVLADHGQTLFPEAHFYSDEKCFERSYDFVLASGSLHYSFEWRSVLKRLAGASRGYVFVTRQPFIQQSDSYVFVQRPYRHGFDTEYVGWCLNQAEFLAQAEAAGLTLIREFMTGEKPFIVNAPEQCEYKGFLFRKSDKAHSDKVHTDAH